ncbi:MAG: DNA primase [Saprospiraceae bacterium]|nr:DNA primase [Saprospiraceae bacterium]
MISQRTIDEIFNTAQIEDLVGDFVDLKKRGSNYVGLCPFHDEKTPSFSVSPSKNIYKCFGCDRGGNPVNFIMEHEQMNYPEALRYIAAKYGIEIEEEQLDPEAQEKKETRESLYIVNKLVSEYYQDQLFNTDHGRSVGLSYFKQRAYPEHIIRKFELGFAPSTGTALKQYAEQKGVKQEHLEALGLVTDKGYDFFRSRVIFPIHNVTGKVIAFAGRSLTKDKKSPKYINSRESEIYNKSWVLYGLHLAKKEISSADECLLVEGYTDVISLHMQGVENVVASSGTALTAGQIKLIKRYTPNILILYDGDEAGIKAALRGVDLILEQDMNVRIALLPEGQDPDSFVKSEGMNGFKKFIEENARDFILFKSALLLEEAQGDPVKTTVLIKDIVESIAVIPDALKRSLYVKQCAEKFDLSEEVLLGALNQALRKRAKKENRFRQKSQSDYSPPPLSPVPKKEQPIAPSNDEVQERDIVRILLKSGDQPFPGQEGVSVAEYLIANLTDIIDNFDNEHYKKIIIEYAQLLDEGKSVDWSYFTNHADEATAKLAVDLLSDKYIYSENWFDFHQIILSSQKDPDKNYEKECQQGLLRLKFRKINKLISENSQAIKDLQERNEEEKLVNALQIHERLVNQRNEIASLMSQVVI